MKHSDSNVNPTVISEPSDSPLGAIHRRYFTAAIASVLTVGAVWGAWLLWRIGMTGSFTGISLHEINAHGHAQIFGWVGLFIMGGALQVLPRWWGTNLRWPRLAGVAFLLMLTGLCVVTAGMGLHGRWSASVPAVIVGSAMETAAAVLLILQLAATFRRSGQRWEPYVVFVFTALLWLLVQTVFGAWHAVMTMTAPDREAMLWYVATYQAPLRDAQVHGMAMFMIFGMAMLLLPQLFSLPRIPPRRAWVAWALLLAAVIGEIAIFLAYRHSGRHWVAALLMAPWIMLAVAVWLIAGPWRFWRPMVSPHRSAKFIRAAFLWLAASLVMLLLMPVYQHLSGIAFSHAYYGAIRHAVTVGFVSLMIMGMAARLVKSLHPQPSVAASLLWGPFILINTGCFLRVSLQTLTDFHPIFFAFVGISGMLEVAALAWWGADLLRMMWQRPVVMARHEKSPRHSGHGLMMSP